MSNIIMWAWAAKEEFANYDVLGLTGGDEEKTLSDRKISYTCKVCNDGVVREKSLQDLHREGCKGCQDVNRALLSLEPRPI